jgi:hypothetical protein
VVSESKFRRGTAEVRTPTRLCHHELNASRDNCTCFRFELQFFERLDLTNKVTIEVTIFGSFSIYFKVKEKLDIFKQLTDPLAYYLFIVTPCQVNTMPRTPSAKKGKWASPTASQCAERFANFRIILTPLEVSVQQQDAETVLFQL